MVFYQLLDQALAGCGTSRAEEEASSVFQTRLRTEQRHWSLHHASSALLHLDMRHVSLMAESASTGIARYQQFLERFEETLPAQELIKRVWLRHLGYCLARAGSAHLARLDCLAEIEACKDNPTSGLLQRVMRKIRGSITESCWFTDRLEVSAGQVLPIHFDAVTPSCLGRAQIVAGVARMLKTKGLFSVPVRTHLDNFTSDYLWCVQTAKQFFRDHPVVLADFKFLRNIQRLTAELECTERTPSWMHGVVSLYLNERFIYLDPNQYHVGPNEQTWYLPNGELSWRNYSTPGSSMFEARQANLSSQYQRGKVEDRLTLLGSFMPALSEQLQAGDDALLRLIGEFLRKNRLSQELISSAVSLAETNKQDPLLAEKALALLAGVSWPIVRFASREVLKRYLPSGELLQMVARRIPYCLLSSALTKFELCISETRRNSQFPVIEHYPLQLAMAVYTMRHLAVCEGLTGAFAAEAVHYCCGQFLLWDVVCATEAGSSETRLAAFELLSSYRSAYRLKSANRALGEFADLSVSPTNSLTPMEQSHVSGTTKAFTRGGSPTTGFRKIPG